MIVLFGLRISYPSLNIKYQKMYLVWTLVEFNEFCWSLNIKKKKKKNCLLEKYGYNWWELDIVEMDLNLLEFLC